MGFTVAIFVTGLAFASNPAAADQAKVGVLLASVLAGVVGSTILLLSQPGRPGQPGRPEMPGELMSVQAGEGDSGGPRL